MIEQTAITTAAETAITENGYSDLDDFQLPRWRIDKDNGTFIHDYGDQKEIISTALLKVSKSRVMWPARYAENSRPECRSHNLAHPEELDPVKAPFGMVDTNNLRTCAGCPLAEWTDDGQERIKPQCALTYDLLLLDLETGMLGVLSLMRTRAKVGQVLNGFWKMTHMRFGIRLGTEKVNGPAGQWWGVTFERAATFEPDQREQLISMATGFKHWSLSTITLDFTQEAIE